MNIAVILASGSGKRFGSDIPKQFLQIKDKTVVEYVIDACKKSVKCDKIILVLHKDYMSDFSFLRDQGIYLCEGGKERNNTIQNSLNFIMNNNLHVKKICFLDSARPLITSVFIDEIFDNLDNNDAVITCKKITDSLANINNFGINREEYFLVQTPEAFKYNVLFENFDEHSNTTALIQQLPKQSKIHKNFNLLNNLKITYPQDLKIAQMYLEP